MPCAERLDASLEFQGMSSPMRFLGCPSNKARRVWARELTGFPSLILQLVMSQTSMAELSAPTSCLAKTALFAVRAIFLIWFSTVLVSSSSWPSSSLRAYCVQSLRNLPVHIVSWGSASS